MRSFEKLVKEYVKAIDYCLSCLESHSEEKGKYQQIREGHLGLNESHYFQFHGSGCLFINNGIKIDFELPNHKRSVLPIDLFFLTSFWEGNDEKFGYKNSDEIMLDYEEAKSGKWGFEQHPFLPHLIETSFPKQFRVFADEFYE